MKLKSIITAIFVVALLLGGRVAAKAQGIYSTDNDSNTDTKVANTEISDDPVPGGIFAADGDDDDDWGSGGQEGPGAPGGDAPVGEGILILSLLSGAYALVKRNVRRKDED